jgi:hypothetical protein
MIHRPTFRINGINQFLVTAMSIIGALFVGTPGSKIQAGKIFRQLNKVVLATVIPVSASLLIREVGECSGAKEPRGHGSHENGYNWTTLCAHVWRTLLFLHRAKLKNPVYMAIFFSFHGTVVAVYAPGF